MDHHVDRLLANARKVDPTAAQVMNARPIPRHAHDIETTEIADAMVPVTDTRGTMTLNLNTTRARLSSRASRRWVRLEPAVLVAARNRWYLIDTGGVVMEG